MLNNEQASQSEESEQQLISWMRERDQLDAAETAREGTEAAKEHIRNRGFSPRDLRRLRRNVENCGYNLGDVISQDPANALATLVFSQDDVDNSFQDELIESILGEDFERAEDEDFVRGFIQGALQEWDRLSGKL